MQIDELAALAKVSKTTVSLVLNGKAKKYRISPETEGKVLALVKKTGFKPNQLARGFRMNSLRSIGLVIGDVRNWFFSSLEQVIEREAAATGYSLIITSSDEDPGREKAAVASLLSRSVDAVILASVFPTNKEHRKINIQNIPFIYLDRHVGGKGALNVETDNRKATFELVSGLVKKGRSKIAYIGGDARYSTEQERFQGYSDALEKSGIRLVKDLVRQGHFGQESGVSSAKEILGRTEKRPDAIFCSSFTLLEGVLHYLKTEGKGERSGLKLSTFDDHPLLDFLAMGIDSIRQDCELLGKSAFTATLDSVAKKKVHDSKIAAKLIERDW